MPAAKAHNVKKRHPSLVESGSTIPANGGLYWVGEAMGMSIMSTCLQHPKRFLARSKWLLPTPPTSVNC